MNRLSIKLIRMLENYYQSQGLGSYRKHIDNGLIKWICQKSDDFKKATRKGKIQKLSGEEFSYLVSTLENNHKLENGNIKNLLLNKLEIIEANQLRGKALYPDIDTLFASLKHGWEWDRGGGSFLYFLLLTYLKDTNYEAAKKYCDIVDALLSTKSGVLKKMDFYELQLDHISCWDPEHLKLFLNYDCDNQLKSGAFQQVMNIDYDVIAKFNDLDKRKFNKVLNFIMESDSFDSKIHIIGALLKEKQCISILVNIVDKIDRLPKHLIEYLGKTEHVDDKIREDQKRLLEEMCKMDQEANNYYISVLNTPKEQASNLLELLVNDHFRKFSMETRTFILQKLAYFDRENQEKDQVRYLMKANFLVGNEETPGFLTKIDNSYFESTFKFIQDEKDKEVLDTKFLVLDRLRKQIEEGKLSIEIYQRYLESLENAISNMNFKDKIKYLDSHSKFFKKHNLEEFSKNITHSKVKDTLVDVLSENEKYKRAKYHYKLVSFIDQYDPMVATKIIERMKNCQRVYNKKEFFHKVQEIPFITMDKFQQQNILDHHSLGSPLVFGSQEESGMEVWIPDYQYVQSVLENNPSDELEFNNKDARIKIKLRKKGKKKK